MAKTAAGKPELFDIAKAFGDLRFPGFDVEAVVETQRKNLEALTQANQLAFEGAQALARRQAEIVQRAVEEVSELLREWAQPGAPEDRMAKNAEVAKQAFEKGIANFREFNELATKASSEVLNVFTRRLTESLDEMRSYGKRQIAAE